MASGDLFLFLENDWVALEGPSDLYTAAELLRNGVVDVARLRHRRIPGHPLWTLQFKDDELSKPTHLLDSIHWIAEPTTFHPYISELGDGWYKASSRNANWTNNPTIFRTEWLRDHIVPKLGNKDIEVDIQEWWEQQDFMVGQGSGIFTHKRIG